MEIRNTLIIGIVLLLSPSMNSNAQGVISCIEMNVLYRGYRNVIELGSGGLKKDVKLVSKDVTLSKTDSTSTTSPYYATTKGLAKEAVIYVVSQDLKDTLLVKKYRVRNLPPPVMFLGEHCDGGQVYVNDSIISMHYGREFLGPTTIYFEVVTYELIIEGEPNTFKGKGNTFSPEVVERLRYLSENHLGPIKITIQSTIKGPDGVTRKKSGSFKLE